jgi:hypothetical protein
MKDIIEIPEWERQPFDGSRTYLYFCVYRDMDPLERSIKKTAEETKRSLGMLWNISSRWDWAKRAEAYDLHMQRLKLAAYEQARIEMAERQAKEGMTLQSVAMGGIRDLIDERGQVKANLTPTEIVRLLETGVRIERLARGESTENVDEKISGEVKVVRLPTPIVDDEEWASRAQAEYNLRCQQRELISPGALNSLPHAGDLSS